MPQSDDLIFIERQWWHILIFLLPPFGVLATFLWMKRYRFDGFLPNRFVLPMFFSIAYVGLWALICLIWLMLWASGEF